MEVWLNVSFKSTFTTFTNSTGNPRSVAQQIIQQNYRNDPMMQSILQMGLNNDTKGLEQMARQLLGQQGRDFDTELANLKRIQNLSK